MNETVFPEAAIAVNDTVVAGTALFGLLSA